MKKIILKYFFIPLFGSFNGGNEMSRREHSFLSILLKSQIFIPPKIGRNGGKGIKFNNFFTKTPKIPLYIQFFILK